ncbi:MAG: DUF2079 domain-containing protein, partial [Chloroflexota bacterium]|nr:DUF2079 domain-containing protein [Chloroflexota bacterium]
AEHVALILVPISWLYQLWPDPRLLLGIHQLALALLGWPLFVLARRALSSDAQALVVLACFYLTPSLAGVALDDFHAVPIATVPLAVGLALVLTGRPQLGAAIALLALPMEEETALAVGGLGALLWARRQRLLGMLVGSAALVWLATMVFVVMPRFHDPRTLDTVDGNRTLHHFEEIRAEPAKIADRLLGERGRDAAVWLGLPTGGLALLSPSTLLVGAPTFAVLFLQDRDDTFGRHWVVPVTVALWFATALGLARLPRGGRRSAGIGLLVAGTALSYVLVSPLPGGGRFDAAALETDERTYLLERAVQQVPEGAVVVASPNVVAHLANRAEAYVFPIDSHYAQGLGWRRKRPDFYVLDLADELTSRVTVSERLNPLEADRPFHIWSPGRKVLVLSDEEPRPSHPLDARYGDRLLLKGYDVERTPDGTLVRLYWERYDTLRGRYDRELTVLNQEGETVLYEFDMALSSTYGSNKWKPGQTIVDEVLVPPAEGLLTLRIGWVAQDKRRPFLLADGSEAFDLVLPGDR